MIYVRIGILGCGNIGSFLLEKINKEKHASGKIVAVYSRSKEKTNKIATNYNSKAYDTLEEFLAADLDLVVEVATIELIQEVALKVIEKSIPLIVSSIGVFSDELFLQEMKKACETYNTQIFIPSGAVGSLDALKSAKALNNLEKVKLTTRKPADSLQAAKKLTEEKVVFSGKAKQAIERFPRNMNVAIAISLAGIGSENTEVELIADPKVSKNIHNIEAKGDFGELSFTVINEAMPDNPKTSYLAALSVLSSIKDYSNRLQII